MPALSDAQTAAYTAFLKGKRESYSLTEEVVTKLAAWFKTKGVREDPQLSTKDPWRKRRSGGTMFR